MLQNKDLVKAISDAAKSIAESLTEEKVKHEIALVQRNWISPAWLRMLGRRSSATSPYADEYVHRHDVIIASSPSILMASPRQRPIPRPATLSLESWRKRNSSLSASLLRRRSKIRVSITSPSRCSSAGAVGRALRELFQDKIGWKPVRALDAGTRRPHLGKPTFP
jgi:hypothetical protein